MAPRKLVGVAHARHPWRPAAAETEADVSGRPTSHRRVSHRNPPPSPAKTRFRVSNLTCEPGRSPAGPPGGRQRRWTAPSRSGVCKGQTRRLAFGEDLAARIGWKPGRRFEILVENGDGQTGGFVYGVEGGVGMARVAVTLEVKTYTACARSLASKRSPRSTQSGDERSVHNDHIHHTHQFSILRLSTRKEENLVIHSSGPHVC